MKLKSEILTHKYWPRFVWNWPVLSGSKCARVMFGNNVMLKYTVTDLHVGDYIFMFHHN